MIKAGDERPVIRLWSVAGPSGKLLDRLQLTRFEELFDLAQQWVGKRYRVMGDIRLMNPPPSRYAGQRNDDRQRLAEIHATLADDQTRAVFALRGGAWLLRLLPHVDFTLLARRKNPLHLFGFSELTTLLNLTANYRQVRCYYHPTGAVMLLAPERLDRRRLLRRTISELMNFVEQRQSPSLSGRLVAGRIRGSADIRVVGGCLSVLTAIGPEVMQMMSQPVRGRKKTPDWWLALEDINEPSYRLDRYLAQLKWAGVLERCSGILLGDFHQGKDDQTRTVLEMMPYHLPAGREMPIVARLPFGHRHGCRVLPLGQPMRLSIDSATARVKLQGI
ncbi:MAG: putative murein peptide carboxypeptidase [Phycisphaerae bacterium]|nr:putative murein peptide carboxypeptidase [Phycisphaerae bacterium]